MKSPVVKRSIVIAGHKTSVSLEDAFWRGLFSLMLFHPPPDQRRQSRRTPHRIEPGFSRLARFPVRIIRRWLAAVRVSAKVFRQEQ